MNKRTAYGIIVIIAIISLAACSFDQAGSVDVKATNNQLLDKVNLSAKEAQPLIKANLLNPNFIIVDIRTPREYQSGHIAKAINIDFYSRDFSNKLNDLDKTKTYIFHCRSGSRTGQAEKLIKKLGLKKYYILSRGIVDWNANNYELIN